MRFFHNARHLLPIHDAVQIHSNPPLWAHIRRAEKLVWRRCDKHLLYSGPGRAPKSDPIVMMPICKHRKEPLAPRKPSWFAVTEPFGDASYCHTSLPESRCCQRRFH